MSTRVRIERSEASDPETGDRYWRIVDLDLEPCEENYWGLLADGCESLSDAMACAVGYGWVLGGGDSPELRPADGGL